MVIFRAGRVKCLSGRLRTVNLVRSKWFCGRPCVIVFGRLLLYGCQSNDCLNSKGVKLVLFLNSLLNDWGYSKPNR